MFEFLHQLENPAIGIWTFVHLFAGIVAGIATASLRVNGTLGFIVLFTVAVGWEVFEIFIGITETFGNRIVDIGIALALYVPAYFILRTYVQNQHIAFALTALSVILYGVSLYVVYQGII